MTSRIAIVGRPNVGKSTLANRLAGTRVSIVEPTAGVTRDRIALPATLPGPWGERHVEVVDTGGIGIVDRDDLGPHVEEQVRAALATADLILFVVDARDGVTPLDREVASRLRGSETPVLLVANKVEAAHVAWEVDAFHSLGIPGDPVAISAQNGNGVEDLCERVVEMLPAPGRDDGPRPRPVMRLAVVGRRNAGKSTLINRLAREERVIVSEVPGTTRDAVDVVIEREGETFVLIDTAGVRKKKSMADAVEFYSDARSHKAVRRADVVLLLFDATEPLSALEKRLARYVADHYKPVVLGANKWDLTEGVEPADYEDYLAQELPGLSWAPVSFLSGKSGFQVQETFELARELYDSAHLRIGTGELNRVLQKALEARSPSSKGHRVRLKYATQVGTAPPTFVLFLNDKRLVGKSYLRYLENRLRSELPFENVPVKIVLRDGISAPHDDVPA